MAQRFLRNLSVFFFQCNYSVVTKGVFTPVACLLCSDLGVTPTQLLHLSLGSFVFSRQKSCAVQRCKQMPRTIRFFFLWSEILPWILPFIHLGFKRFPQGKNTAMDHQWRVWLVCVIALFWLMLQCISSTSVLSFFQESRLRMENNVLSHHYCPRHYSLNHSYESVVPVTGANEPIQASLFWRSQPVCFITHLSENSVFTFVFMVPLPIATKKNNFTGHVNIFCRKQNFIVKKYF